MSIRIGALLAIAFAAFSGAAQAEEMPKCSDDLVVLTVTKMLVKNGEGTLVPNDPKAYAEWEKSTDEAGKAVSANLGGGRNRPRLSLMVHRQMEGSTTASATAT
jgi:hypothetical protein